MFADQNFQLAISRLKIAGQFQRFVLCLPSNAVCIISGVVTACAGECAGEYSGEW